MTESGESYHDIAVIGMVCRLPGAADVEQYWRNIRDGVESISSLTDAELDAAGVSEELRSRDNYVRSAGGWVDDIDKFDAAFFGMSPREAEITDPQQRLFLEVCHEALEVAGYDPQSYDGLIGVFGGAGFAAYAAQIVNTRPELIESMGAMGILIGAGTDYLPTRVSYTLDLRGPSVNVQTACSTGLVAAHLACQSLLIGDCDVAIAGGVSITTIEKVGYLWEEGAIYSPDGHCRAFDHKAAGIVGGNGVAVVVLKRLAAALEDGDHIRAVIRGSAINNDGSGRVGFTAPGVDGQARVIADAIAMAGVEPDTIGYVEGHGTGTNLGDPIELKALTRAFRSGTDRRGFCGLGSVKTNIGHTNTASGVAGLIKAVLCLEHRELVPTLHFERPNPELRLDDSPFRVIAARQPWQVAGHPRRAGVSSFGIGGTNAHVVVEEAPDSEPGGPSRAAQLLVISARSQSALDTATRNLAAHLHAHPDLDIADVAFTQQVGRRAMPVRRFAVVTDTADAIAALNDAQRLATGIAPDKADRPVAFMFPGQGAQYVEMARGLYDSEPVFREQVDRCAELLAPHLGLDLREVLYPDAERAAEAEERLGRTELTQPALFVIEYALAELWRSFGIRPQAVVGHSIGEYVAACLAGVFALEDALALVAARGRLMAAVPEGDMLVVGLPEAEAMRWAKGEVSLAAINGPSSCVLSGPPAAIAAVRAQLEAAEQPCQVLHTSHAFHSAMMDAVTAPFAEIVAKVELSPAKLPCVSTVTGTWIDPAEWADPAYWVRNARDPVRFADASRTLLAEPEMVLLEVGPGRTLSTLTRQHTAEAAGRAVVPSLRHPKDGQPDLAFALDALGRLWLAGVRVDWEAFRGDERRRRVPLPTYPFERQSYWLEANPSGAPRRAPASKRTDVAEWFYAPSWTRTAVPAAIELPRSWLVFADELGLGARLAADLRVAGHPVVVVEAASDFAAAGDGFAVRPGDRDHLARLVDRLRATGRLPDAVAYLWNFVPLRDGALDLAALPATQERAFYGLFHLAQVLAEQVPDHPVRIEVVTNDLFDVVGGEARSPERATALGPVKVIPLELPQLSCRHVDVATPTADTLPDLGARLLREWASEPGHVVVAHRGPHRWEQGIAPTRLPAAPADAHWRRRGGVYLITGGLGGIGLVIAGHLADQLGAKLVLTGRSGLPPRNQWNDLLARAGAADREARRMRAVLDLERRGAEVMVVGADVADAARMREVVAAARQRFGAVHGVVHSAGLSTGGMIALRTRAAAAEVLDPKVAGTLILREALREVPLDFFFVCSSLNSLLGAVGATDYCGANAFLDALAGVDPGVTAVCWDAWTEVGMAAETEVSEALRRDRQAQLAKGILSIEGADAFERALASQQRHLYVSASDLGVRIAESLEHAVADADAPGAATPATEVAHARPNLPTPYAPPTSELETAIAAVAQELLGIDRVGIHDNLFDLGFDSLLAQRLVARLKNHHDIALPVKTILETPNVAQLGEYVEAAQWIAESRGN